MNKFFFGIVFLILGIFFQNFAKSQSILFAKSFNENGEPIEKRNTWNIDSAETRIAVVFNNGKQTISQHRLSLEIKPENDSAKILFMRVGSNKNWVAEYVDFTEPGKYIITVKDDKDKTLAQSNVYFKGNTEIKNNEELIKPEVVSQTFRYNKAEIYFRELSKDGKPLKDGNEYKLESKGKYIEIVLVNGNELGTDKITIDVWKKSSSNNEYNEHVDAKEFKIDRKKNSVVMHFSFRKAGEYKISLFDSNFTWITSGYLKIVE